MQFNVAAAIGVGILVLFLMGPAPDTTKFAVIAAVIAGLVIKKTAQAAGGGHH